ncbi:hypothetical protein B0T22DRAFT_445502 [Podospora appendiculata]|uniref:Uncharacterized protein n=1 Tax=Podospora appendiculata TaxID=314037 RepID=A0AAE0WZ26_9PEZI|nr:hypothetical protein B0T22DRAFT_445502 [Podospora appendiculata]
MERYKVTFVSASGREETILVPFQSVNSIATFHEEIVRQLRKAKVQVESSDLQFRLDSTTGGLLCEDDPIGSVILDPRQEVVFALEKYSAKPSVIVDLASPVSPPDDVKIEPLDDIVRPEIAPSGMPTIPPESTAVSNTTTLRQLRQNILKHLSLPDDSETSTPSNQLECNCSLAQTILIHSKTVMEPMDCTGLGLGQDTVLNAVKERLHFLGSDSEVEEGGSPPPIVTIFSAARHEEEIQTDPSDTTGTSEKISSAILDLHTAESPFSTSHLDLSLSELGLGAV